MSLIKDIARKDLSFQTTLFQSADAQLAVYKHNDTEARVYGLYIIFNCNYYQYYYSLSVSDLIGNLSISGLSEISHTENKANPDESYYATAG
jgi:hypothetical protein